MNFIVRKQDDRYYIALSRKPVLAGTMYFGEWISFVFKDKYCAEDAVYLLNGHCLEEYVKIIDGKYPEDLIYKMLGYIMPLLEIDKPIKPKAKVKPWGYSTATGQTLYLNRNIDWRSMIVGTN